MLSGLQLLQGFDDRLRRAQAEAAAAQQEVDRLSLQRDSLRATEAQALRQLARLRLANLNGGNASALARLDDAGGRALKALEQRSRAIAEADAALQAARQRLTRGGGGAQC